ADRPAPRPQAAGSPRRRSHGVLGRSAARRPDRSAAYNPERRGYLIDDQIDSWTFHQLAMIARERRRIIVQYRRVAQPRIAKRRGQGDNQLAAIARVRQWQIEKAAQERVEHTAR